MIELSISSFFLLSLLFFSLPLHVTPISLGVRILLIIISLLVFFISSNITLAAIFITLVYIRGILILFSYFFSLIQNTKIFIVPLALSLILFTVFLLRIFYWKFNLLEKRLSFAENFSLTQRILWVLNDTKVVIFLILVLLLSILFIEKIVGLKQKPLRLK